MTVRRLATYGTLSPGRPNHGQLAAVGGRWTTGRVRGTLWASGWGAALGYPALVLHPDGPAVDVAVLESPDLADHLARLDAFEGPGYRRVLTTVRTPEGDVAAWIYVVAEEPAP